MAIKTIIFDLDNTLVNFMEMKRATAKAVARLFEKEGVGDRRKLEKEIFAIYDEFGIEYQRTFTVLLRRHRCYSTKLLKKAVDAYFKEQKRTLKPYPGVIPALKRLKKRHRLILFTDAPRKQALKRLRLTGLMEYFDTIVTAKGKKATGLPIKRLMRRFHLKPAETLVVGDSMKRDILPARWGGIRAATNLWAMNKFL